MSRTAVLKRIRVELVGGVSIGNPSSLFPVFKLRSPVKKAVFGYLVLQRDASDKEIWEWLIKTSPKVIPASWEQDDSLPGKLFTKVRKLLKSSSPTHHGTLSTAITRQ